MQMPVIIVNSCFHIGKCRNVIKIENLFRRNYLQLQFFMEKTETREITNQLKSIFTVVIGWRFISSDCKCMSIL